MNISGKVPMEQIFWGYRYKQGEPEELSRNFIDKSPIPTVLAGSIGSEERIKAVKAMNPWLFTMGSALFEGNFVEGRHI